jgi:hypothetical protein
LRLASPPATHVSDLERQLKQVALAYDDFARRMSRFEGVQQTVRLNVGNFEAALARHELPARGPLAGLQAMVRRTVQQMEADEGYYRSAVEGASVTLDALHVQAQIERGQVEDRRNLIIAFLGVSLAMGELITDAVAQSFLGWMATWLQWIPGGSYTPAQLFATRLVLAVLMGLAGMVIVWGIGRLRHRL